MANTITIEMEDEETGEMVEHQLPAKFEVCSRCEGNGKHMNPNIDGNGISPEQFRDDPDFEESYFRGDYDVSCEECEGERVVAVVDEANCDPAILAAYLAQEHADADYEWECRQERRAEAWACGERD
jgi:hypothetical protein